MGQTKAASQRQAAAELQGQTVEVDHGVHQQEQELQAGAEETQTQAARMTAGHPAESASTVSIARYPRKQASKSRTAGRNIIPQRITSQPTMTGHQQKVRKVPVG